MSNFAHNLCGNRRDSREHTGISMATLTSSLEMETKPEVSAAESEPWSFVAAAAEGVRDESESLAQVFTCHLKDGDESQALLITLCHSMLRIDRGQHYYHYWFSETVRHQVPSWCEPKVAESLLRILQDAISMGINLRGREPQLFLKALESVLGPSSPWADAILGDRPSNYALTTQAAALAYAGSNLELALRVTAAAPCFPRYSCFLTASMAGLFYGREDLGQTDKPHFIALGD